MKRLLGVFGVSLCLLSACRPEPESVEKPTPPIDVDLQLVGNPDPGQPFTIQVTTSCRTPGDVSLTVTLPSGTVRLDGETQWCGRMLQGQTHDLRIDLSVPDLTPREVFVTAECRIDSNTKVAQCVSLGINGSPSSPQGTPQRNRRGEGILDFQYR